MTQFDVNLVLPTALACGAFLLMAFALATQGQTPDSGILLLPGATQFGSSIS